MPRTVVVSMQEFGDTALVVQAPTARPAAETLAWVRATSAAIAAAAPTGVVDVVPSPDRVTVVFDPLRVTDRGKLVDGIERLLGNLDVRPQSGRRHEIPVVYGGEAGPDLDDVCRRHGLERAELIRLHTEPDYSVTAIGFVPGFPYLAGLPERLATPRRATPRTNVPAGAIGIGGGQTGIYPCATPGGWHLIGRTAVRLFDPHRHPPALFAIGDRVRFQAVEALEFPPLREPRPSAASGPSPTVEVLVAGLHTTVQDLGRPGHRAAGVPHAGAADPVALRLANLLVGNPEEAAGVECTLAGPTLRFSHDTVVALCGAEFSGLPCGRPIRIAAGETLCLGGASRGCRGLLALAGGIELPAVLGSCSTYVPAGLGGLDGRPLVVGDRLPLGSASLTHPTPGWSLATDLQPLHSADCTLRFLPASTVSAACLAALATTAFNVTGRSDRMGLRLKGPPLPATVEAAVGVSVAVLPGTIQVPPDGQPILLLADAQTIGGYPLAGQVIAADLPLAGQLRPGDRVQFSATTLPAALVALREREAMISLARHGIVAHHHFEGRHDHLSR